MKTIVKIARKPVNTEGHRDHFRLLIARFGKREAAKEISDDVLYIFRIDPGIMIQIVIAVRENVAFAIIGAYAVPDKFCHRFIDATCDQLVNQHGRIHSLPFGRQMLRVAACSPLHQKSKGADRGRHRYQ
ncbi:hypothetical protein ACFOKF_07320 [Sphingobium rhizovicinum]|uniref:Uncharacterized protein n=1 Tax=Sphingobium rhizovicinum TaxID=432308 RepID=A0ABV7NCU8_9SPHN